jgi:hypothetical protein
VPVSGSQRVRLGATRLFHPTPAHLAGKRQ